MILKLNVAEPKEFQDPTHNTFLGDDNKMDVDYFPSVGSPSLSSSSFEGSTPSTQRSIPPPTVRPKKQSYIITTTTENPSPTRRQHSIRRFIYICRIENTQILRFITSKLL